MLANSLPTLVGLLAGALSTSSLVPQVLKCWREGLTQAVSKKMVRYTSLRAGVIPAHRTGDSVCAAEVGMIQ